jgi:O-succinylbenzoic acid--CoA ligase
MSEQRISRVSLTPYTFDVGRTLVTTHGSVRYRRGFALAVEDTEGRIGWGDAAHFPGFGSSDELIGSQLGAALPSLEGVPIDGLPALEALLARESYVPEVRYAIELALLDLLGQATGRSLAQLLSPEARDHAETHVLLTSTHSMSDAAGASTFKLKIGRDLDEVVRRLRELREHVGPIARIRLDANGAFEREQALGCIERVAPFGIELIEQPIAAGKLAELAEVRRAANARGITIAADEDVTDEGSVEAVALHAAADAVVLKPMFLGGLVRSRRLADRARALGLEVIVTHALESAIGRTGALHLAATLPGTHGLAWAPAEDIADVPAREGTRIPLPSSPGLGVAPRRARAFAPSPASDAASHEPPTVADPLRSSARTHPDHVAVEADGRTLSYGALVGRAAKVARALVQNGLRRGARVGLAGPPSLDWVVALHALRFAGAVACPLPHWPTPAEREAAALSLDISQSLDTTLPLPESIDPLPEAALDLAKVQVVIATSGSTGSPRAIPLTGAQLAWSAFGSALRLGHAREDRWLCPLPLHHVGGLSILLRCAFGSTTAVLHPRFDARTVAEALDSGTCSLVSLTPTMLERVLDARPSQPFPKALRALLVGGGPCSDALLERCGALNVPVSLTWGMTEAASQIATRVPGDVAPIASGMPPLPFTRISVSDAALEVEGPTVRGVLRTADRGLVRADGRVVVLGRIDDVIVRGGENLDPREIEAVLAEHPSIADAAVIGVPSPTHGQDVAAVLVAKGVRPTADELARHCRERLAAFKVPTCYAWVESLPRTSLGKLARGSLAARFEETDATKPVEQERGWRGGSHVAELNADMHELAARANVGGLTGSRDRVREDERASPELLERDVNIEAVVKADRSNEVGLRVNERKTDARLRDETLDVRASREQQFLVSGMAHLEHATEEQDPGPIHLEEAGSDAMNERHDHERRQQP